MSTIVCDLNPNKILKLSRKRMQPQIQAKPPWLFVTLKRSPNFPSVHFGQFCSFRCFSPWVSVVRSPLLKQWAPQLWIHSPKKLRHRKPQVLMGICIVMFLCGTIMCTRVSPSFHNLIHDSNQPRPHSNHTLLSESCLGWDVYPTTHGQSLCRILCTCHWCHRAYSHRLDLWSRSFHGRLSFHARPLPLSTQILERSMEIWLPRSHT